MENNGDSKPTNLPGVYEHPGANTRLEAQSEPQADGYVRMGYRRVGPLATAVQYDPVTKYQDGKPLDTSALERQLKDAQDQARAAEERAARAEARAAEADSIMPGGNGPDSNVPKEPTLNDLRAEAKELGLPAGGSKEELTQRIAAAADAQKEQVNNG